MLMTEAWQQQAPLPLMAQRDARRCLRSRNHDFCATAQAAAERTAAATAMSERLLRERCLRCC